MFQSMLEKITAALGRIDSLNGKPVSPLSCINAETTVNESKELVCCPLVVVWVLQPK